MKNNFEIFEQKTHKTTCAFIQVQTSKVFTEK